MAKIHQLPMGARFEYEGEEYVKTGPPFATGKGGQRLIPKYAVLKLAGSVAGEAADAAPAPVALTKASTLAAFESFYARCLPLVPEDRRDVLAEAREAFLDALTKSA